MLRDAERIFGAVWLSFSTTVELKSAGCRALVGMCCRGVTTSEPSNVCSTTELSYCKLPCSLPCIPNMRWLPIVVLPLVCAGLSAFATF